MRKLLRKLKQDAVVSASNVQPNWSEFYTLMPVKNGKWLVWDEFKHEVVEWSTGATRQFDSYLDALKFACKAPRQCYYITEASHGKI